MNGPRRCILLAGVFFLSACGDDDDVVSPRLESVGPTLAATYTVAFDPFDPDTLYLGTGAGFERSRDGGETWEHRQHPLDDIHPLPDAWRIAPAPSREGRLYLGVFGPSVYRSDDRGDSWSVCDCGTEDCQFHPGQTQFMDLVVDPTDPDTLYAAMPRDCRAGTANAGTPCEGPGGVYRSTDGCQTFTQVNDGIPFTVVQSLAIDPQRPEVLYASAGIGIYRSEDRGDSWTLDYDTSPYTGIGSMTVSRDGVVYAAVNQADESLDPWLLRRDPETGTWAAADDGLRQTPLPDRGLCLDGGECPKLRAQGVWVNASNPRAVLVATHDYGVFESRDGGDSFTNILGEDHEDTSRRLFLAVSSPNDDTAILAARQSDGVLRSDDGGSSWSEIFWRAYATDFAFSPADPDLVLATFGANGTALSRDRGKTWDHSLNDVYIADLFFGALDAVDPSIQYVSMIYQSNDLFRSTDGGDRWERIAEGLPEPVLGEFPSGLVAHPSRSRAAFAAFMTQRVFRTNDGGESWEDFGEGLPTQFATAIEIVPSDPAQLVVGSYDESFRAQVYSRQAEGGSWEPVSDEAIGDCMPPCAVQSLAFDAEGRSLYAAAASAGLYRLDGETWERVGASLPAGSLRALAIDAAHPEIVAVGFYNEEQDAEDNHGVFFSRDGGETFQHVGLAGTPIFSLSFVPGESAFLAATTGKSIFRATY